MTLYLLTNKLAATMIRALKVSSDTLFPIVGVTFGKGTTTFYSGVSFVSTSNSHFSLSGHMSQARNSSTALRPPMIDVTSMKAATFVSPGLHSNGASVKYSNGVIVDLNG
jgi:hypothetical protein